MDIQLKNKTKYPIVKIYWNDSNRWDRQYKISEFDFLMTFIISVGYLIKEDKDRITITRDYFPEEEDVRGAITIPKENIIERGVIAP